MHLSERVRVLICLTTLKHEFCSQLTNTDGLVENQLKYAFENKLIFAHEINQIKTECINTQMKNNYFCNEHLISLNFYTNDNLNLKI